MENVDFVVHLGNLDQHKARMMYIHKSLQADNELFKTVKDLSAQLIGISSMDEDMSENRHGFLPTDEALKQQIRQIGEDLNEIGGISMMQYVAHRIAPLLKHPCDSRCLEFAWDGIGEWRC